MIIITLILVRGSGAVIRSWFSLQGQTFFYFKGYLDCPV
jgi:hypothetical protein